MHVLKKDKAKLEDDQAKVKKLKYASVEDSKHDLEEPDWKLKSSKFILFFITLAYL